MKLLKHIQMQHQTPKLQAKPYNGEIELLDLLLTVMYLISLLISQLTT